MSRHRLAFIALPLALAGCLPTWVSPTREDAATLTFVSEAVQGGTYVTPYVFRNGRECKERMKIDLPGLGNLGGDEKAVIRIPPGEEFTVLANVRDPQRTCSLAISFLPKARESYTAVIGGSSAKCTLGIRRSNGKALEAEPSVRKRAWSSKSSGSDAECSEEAPKAP